MKWTSFGLMLVFIATCTCACEQPGASSDVPDRSCTEAHASAAIPSVATSEPVAARSERADWATWIRSLVRPGLPLSALEAQVGRGNAGTDHSYFCDGPEGARLAVFVDE